MAQHQYYGDLGSEFEYDSEADRKRAKRQDLTQGKKKEKTKLPSKSEVTEEYNRDERKIHRMHFLSLDAFSRHKKLVNDYMLYYGGSCKEFKRDTSRDKTDLDVIRENHRFLWSEGEEEDSWEKRMAKKYYDKLFKEYCITDLRYYRENKIAMRWRTEQEVVDGKGQFICGEKKCKEAEGLKSWEVNFGYMEHGEKKNALVKLRLCPECSYKLNYRHKKKEVKKRKKMREEKEAGPEKRQRHLQEDGSESSHRTEEQRDEKGSRDDKTEQQTPDQKEEKSIWSGPAKVTEEKSREEEFDSYFEDMFL